MAAVGSARLALARPPPVCVVHAALVAAQVSFGGGAIVGKFGVHGTNPALFALIREGVAGPLLCLLALLSADPGAKLPRLRDLGRILAAGLAIYSNQLFFLVGLKLNDPVAGSAWQPSQPIFTMILAVLLGYEKISWRQLMGVLIAVAGAIFMVVFGSVAQAKSGETSLGVALVGHALFFLNCLGTSCYVILTKDLLKRYPSVAVTGWSYLTASVMMLITVCVINETPPLLRFVCGDKEPSVRQQCVDEAWHVPSAMLWPLCYWIAFNSILAYLFMTWANQYAKASIVSAYTVLQPATSGLISALLIALNGKRWAEAYGLQSPGVQDIGVLGIIVGLLLLLSEPTMQSPRQGQEAPQGNKVAFLRDSPPPASDGSSGLLTT